MDTIKNEFWWAVTDITNRPEGLIDSIHRIEKDAHDQAERYKAIKTKVERVRVTIDRIKTS